MSVVSFCARHMLPPTKWQTGTASRLDSGHQMSHQRMEPGKSLIYSANLFKLPAPLYNWLASLSAHDIFIHRAVWCRLFLQYCRVCNCPRERRGHFHGLRPQVAVHQFDSEGKVASGELQFVSGLKVKLSVSLLGGERFLYHRRPSH